MALDAGRLFFTVEFGKDLKDRDWFGRMDPYAVVTCANQRVRTKTHTDGGRNPVWAETFTFNIINENTVELALYDSDTITCDDVIGVATVSLAKVRTAGSQGVREMVPLVSKRSGKQRGHVCISMRFEPNSALSRPAQQPMAQAPVAYPQAVAAPPMAYPGAVMAPPPMYYMPAAYPAPYMPMPAQPMYYPGAAPAPLMQPPASRTVPAQH